MITCIPRLSQIPRRTLAARCWALAGFSPLNGSSRMSTGRVRGLRSDQKAIRRPRALTSRTPPEVGWNCLPRRSHMRSASVFSLRTVKDSLNS